MSQPVLIFTNFPMSPSSNKMYASVNGRLIKSKEARNYEGTALQWKWSHLQKIKTFQDNYVNSTIQVDTYFVFRKDRFFTKKGTVRKLDFTNRIKAAHDMLATILNVDDSQFMCGFFGKKYTDGPHDFIEYHITFIEPEEYQPVKLTF